MQLRGGGKLNAKLEPGHLALADGDLGRAADIASSPGRPTRPELRAFCDAHDL